MKPLCMTDLDLRGKRATLPPKKQGSPAKSHKHLQQANVKLPSAMLQNNERLLKRIRHSVRCRISLNQLKRMPGICLRFLVLLACLGLCWEVVASAMPSMP